VTTKTQLRKDISEKRKALDHEWIKTASAHVVKQIQIQDVFQSAKTVALYMAIGGEVDLSSLFPICQKHEKRICIPVFNEKLKFYEMAEITPHTQFKEGHYGIREPVSPDLLSLNDIDVIIVPGVAFAPNGNRLGRGGGYYDRLLDGFAGHTMAAAFDFQIIPQVPCSIHDRPVATIVTETKVIKVRTHY
jgi:5-formyltetrahydrofolate cyclo-ligase